MKASAWCQSLRDMVDVITAAYSRDGLPPDEAHRLASLAIRELAKTMGGRQFYLPRGKRLETALRDASICQEFNGANVNALARRHKITVQRVYQILAENRQKSASSQIKSPSQSR